MNNNCSYVDMKETVVAGRMTRLVRDVSIS